MDDRFIRLGPGMREAWIHRPLAADYADLVRWRDALYSEKRPARSRA